jgi:hypothetical protein
MDEKLYACMAPPDRRWRLTKLISKGWRELKWQAYLHIYCRHIYRHQMRIWHRFGWHWWKRYDLIHDPYGHRISPFDRCEWCGARKENGIVIPPVSSNGPLKI